MERLHRRGGNHNPTGKKAPAEKTKVLTIRCTPEFLDRIRVEAKARRLSQAELLEAALMQYLTTERGDAP